MSTGPLYVFLGELSNYTLSGCIVWHMKNIFNAPVTTKVGEKREVGSQEHVAMEEAQGVADFTLGRRP